MSARRLTRGLYTTPFLTGAECDAILQRCELLAFVPAPIAVRSGASMIRPEIRRAERVAFEETSTAELANLGLGPAPARLFEHALDIDAAHLRTGFTRVQGIQLIRYAAGGHHGWHRDARDSSFRKVSLLAYLDDPASGSFAGGSTAFARNRVAKHLRPTVYTPTRGDVVVFDSRMQHRAEPVTSGHKHVLLMMFV